MVNNDTKIIIIIKYGIIIEELINSVAKNRSSQRIKIENNLNIKLM